MFNDISCEKKDNEEECLAHARVVSLYARKFGAGEWSFIDPGSKKKWFSVEENSPQGIWDNIAEKMLLEFAESGCPIFRATTPLSWGKLKSKGHGKLSIHFGDTQATFETVFRIFVSENQLSLYRTVANMCEEHFQSQFPQNQCWSDARWKACLTAGGGAKRRCQCCSDNSGRDHIFPISSRTFRTQSHWSFLTGQCWNSERILPTFLPHRMCVFSSFYHQLWSNSWRSEFEQETNSILSVCWSQGQRA